MINSMMINENEKVKIYHNGELSREEYPKQNEEIIEKTLYERLDPNYIFEDEFCSNPKS